MDQRTLAYINLHAVLGGLRWLCELDSEAKELIKSDDVSVGFAVKGGPEGTLVFKNGGCTFRDGVKDCDIKLPFSSPEKFNGLIDGTVTPVPVKGFTKIGFLLKRFTKLTDILTKYLRPEKEALKDGEFFRISTTLMFNLILDAVEQIGNTDRIGRFSASNIVDGDIRLAIAGGPEGYIHVENHKLTAVHSAAERPMSYMEFGSMQIARQLFDGEINSVATVGRGLIRIGGMISMVDNVNRILDRVSLYLA